MRDIKEFNSNLTETRPQFENIGWTLGNACPYGCKHCYSEEVRVFGQEIEDWMIDRVVSELKSIGVKTVNLGGNEPIFTNGLNVTNSKLPKIINSLVDNGLVVGLTTAGVTMRELVKRFPKEALLLNDVDISIDSPYPDKHNENRGGNIFSMAIEAAEQCNELEIEHTLVMCGMNWNLDISELKSLVKLARETNSNLRINFLKPTKAEHLLTMPSVKQFYEAFKYLMSECKPLDLGEPLLSSIVRKESLGCPCGTKSFRIHSITPDGKIPVSPCVYMHQYRGGDLCVDDLKDITESKEFRVFRQRRENPQLVEGCEGCNYLNACRGGCPARAYFTGERETIFVKDPYCRKEYEKIQDILLENCSGFMGLNDIQPNEGKLLVHQDYLCTLILEPR